MNERIKAILLTASKLSLDERQQLAQALIDTLATDSAEVEQQLFTEDETSGGADEPPQQPTSDVLARYLDT